MPYPLSDLDLREPRIAYFSMEIGLHSDIPTYSGGLGVLAGDTLKSSADLGLPMVAVSLLYRKGYFRQELSDEGRQSEHDAQWNPADCMELLSPRVKVRIEERDVLIQAWRYDVVGENGSTVPVFFLDTDIEENNIWDRGSTWQLYGGDAFVRLKQEAILGIGGVRMLRALGFTVKKFHMNEGHAALLTLELLHRHKRRLENVWDERAIWNEDAVRDLCIFTTHTPVEAGHDRFSYDLVEQALGDYFPLDVLRELGGASELNMSTLGLGLSEYRNGVAKKHGEVSRTMFPAFDIRSITNGVHSRTWTHKAWQELYNEFIPNWHNEPELFIRVDNIPDERILSTHKVAKTELLETVRHLTGVEMSADVFTIGFARRATPYKRADLLFSDRERLAKIARKFGKLQIVYAGKAHPRDEGGKALIQSIHDAARVLSDAVQVVYLPNYEMNLALQIVSGVDVWLNTPQRPHEASGTSGMKATHNGVPNFSVLDGWWIEGHIEDITGWSIGEAPSGTSLQKNEDDDTNDAADLYEKLETKLLPLYHAGDGGAGWAQVMKGAIGKNACYFNTHRMMRQYVTEAYIR